MKFNDVSMKKLFSIAIAAFLVFAGSPGKTELFCGCVCAGIRASVLLRVAAEFANVDEMGGAGLAGHWDCVRGVYDEGVPGAAEDV